VPPAHVVDHLATWLGDVAGPPELRWTPVDRWHVTLGFFGDDDDPVRRTKWLRRRAEGRQAPALRLAGGGTFPGVLWSGVQTRDDRLLGRLAQAAGAGRRGFRPHLTVARWRSGTPDGETLIQLLSGYTGPWFMPDAVVLLRSENQTYTTVDRLPLARD
jgi:2'-5' RNA ligase